MNKKTLIITAIIVVLLIIIAVLVTYIFMSNESENSNLTQIGNEVNQDVNNAIDDGDENNIVEITEVSYAGFGGTYWENLIKEFYQKNFEFAPDSVRCYYNTDGAFEADIYYEESNEEYYYVFDNETNYLIMDNGDVADLINCKFVELDNATGVEFIDNQCLAIGYVNDLNENDFANKYFTSRNEYDGLDTYDFRTENSVKNGYGNKFVIVPKSSNVHVIVYDCFLNNDNEFELDNTLVGSRNTPFIVLDDYIEYTPTMAIVYEYNGFQDTVYINFNGENGHLDLSGHEEEVKDISIYND